MTTMPRPKRILFVCTGNVCRSPMAAGFLLARLRQDGADGQIVVESAGTCALDGHPASPFARQAMGEHALSIDTHRGRTIGQADVDSADLIVVMTALHKQAVLERLQGTEKKVYLLAELAGDAGDVQDPYGGSITEYRATADELESLVDRAYARMRELIDA